MKLHALTAALAVMLSLAGCGRKEAMVHDEHHTVGASFAEGKGLHLPDDMKKAIGLELVEVTERKLAPTWTTEVQVYREAETVALQPVSTDAPAPRALATGFVSADMAKQLRVGQPVKLQSARPPSEELRGTVARLDSNAGPALGGVEVIVEIPDAEKRLRVGTLLQAAITSEREEMVTGIPRSALLETATGTYAYVVNGSHLLRTAVVTGAENAEFIEIKEGLYEGDRVAAQPVLTLWLAELQYTKGGQSCTHGH
jgi:hypothetical protein